MQVFRLYMKIIKKDLPSIMIYIVVFLAIALIMTNTNVKNETNSFTQEQTRIAFFDEDNTKLTNDLKEKIENIAEIIPIENDEEKLKDALFFRQISAIVTIEKGFTEKILKGEVQEVTINSIPNTYDTYYVEMAINGYIGASANYSRYSNLSEEQIVEKVSKDLSNNTSVEFTQEKVTDDIESTKVYFNYLSYVLFATMIMGIGSTMSTINDKNNRRRTIVAPISNKRVNLELTLGHFVYSIALLTIFIVSWIITKPNVFQNNIIYLFILNAFCMMLAILSIAFLIGNFIKNKSAQSAASNVLSLGTSFLGGVFVPMEFLSTTVLNVASFTPTYWFVKANTEIVNLGTINFERLKPILSYMAIEIGFAITFWLISLLVSKYKRISNF